MGARNGLRCVRECEGIELLLAIILSPLSFFFQYLGIETLLMCGSSLPDLSNFFNLKTPPSLVILPLAIHISCKVCLGLLGLVSSGGRVIMCYGRFLGLLCFYYDV